MSRPECRRLPGSPEIRRGILELAIALGVQALADGLDIQGSEELAMRMAATAMTFSQAGPKLADATRADERRIAAVLRNLEEEAAHPLSLDRLAGTQA